jgi:hypothetical protein
MLKTGCREINEMPENRCPKLPKRADWCFDDIARHDPSRARGLEDVGGPVDLLSAIRSALRRAINQGALRLGQEHAYDKENDYRVVVQFAVGSHLIDWFANARTGYRAHFWAHWACGLGFNSRLVSCLREDLGNLLQTVTSGWHVTGEFDNAVQADISRTFVTSSLTPELSKIWLCSKRICRQGGVEPLALGLGGPKLLLNDDSGWQAPFPKPGSAWLDVKGAFLGPTGPYQIKDPISRAKLLQRCGEA